MKSCTCTQQSHATFFEQARGGCSCTALHTAVCVHSSSHCCVRTQLFTLLCAYTPLDTAVCVYSSSHCCVHTQLFTLLCAYTALHTTVCVHSSSHCCVRTQLFVWLCELTTLHTAVLPLLSSRTEGPCVAVCALKIDIRQVLDRVLFWGLGSSVAFEGSFRSLYGLVHITFRGSFYLSFFCLTPYRHALML